MHRVKSRYGPLAAAALGIVGGVASAAQPSEEQLQLRVQQLEQRLAQLEAQRTQQQQQAESARQQVLRDTEQRSQPLSLSSPVTAGYDKGFFIRSDDGRFSLRPGIQLQFRNITNYRSDDDSDVQNGFEIRRARFRFDGNAISPDLTYSIVFDTNRNGGSVSLLDAWAQYRFAPQWAVRGGQFKESVFHEKDVSGFSQLAVDRSVADALLGGTLTERVQGVSLIYGGTKGNPWRLETAFHDGANSRNTDFRDTIPGSSATAPPAYSADYGFGGRAEYKLLGDWGDYKDFTAKGTKADLLVLGAGADWTQRGGGDAVLTTIDAQWESPSGLGLYAALHGNFFNDDGEDRVDLGGLVQAGYLFAPQWEVFGRYDLVALDDSGGDEETFNEFTVGVNHYLGKDGNALHRAKLTLDAVYLPDGAPSNQTGLGILAGDEAEVVLRLQFQLQL